MISPKDVARDIPNHIFLFSFVKYRHAYNIDDQKAVRQFVFYSYYLFLGSPPASKKSEADTTGSDTNFQFPFPSNAGMRIMQAGTGPAITITAMSELESDSETGGNGSIRAGSTGSGGQGPGGMTYLSPFTVITSCASRTASESNLSSSGYSSMASPGPSRSGSSNPLCISESEDTSTPTRASGVFFPKLTVPGMYFFILVFYSYPPTHCLLK